MLIYQLHNDGETIGFVHVTNPFECKEKDISPSEEIQESWTDYFVLAEHEFDIHNVEQFVAWHNTQWVTQLKLVSVEEINAYND